MGRWLDEKQALIAVRAAAEAVGDNLSWAQALLNLCVTQLATGEVPVARANCEQSLELMRETGDKTGPAGAQQALADVLLAEGDIAGAESR